MEQAKNRRIVQNAHSLWIASCVAFAGFAFYSSFLILRTAFPLAGFIALALAVVFFLLSFRSGSLALISISWMLLGILFIGYLVYSPQGNYLTVTISVLLLLGSYELARFSFVSRPILWRIRSLHPESLGRLQIVMRNHSKILVQVLILALMSSLAVEYLTLGEITINPPVVGVTVLASLSILLIVAVMFLRRR